MSSKERVEIRKSAKQDDSEGSSSFRRSLAQSSTSNPLKTAAAAAAAQTEADLSTDPLASESDTVNSKAPRMSRTASSLAAVCSPSPPKANTGRLSNWLMKRNTTSKPQHTSVENARRTWTGATKLVRDLGDTVITVAISADDMFFAAGGTNKLANVYSTSNGALVASFTLGGGVNAVALNGQGDAMLLFA